MFCFQMYSEKDFPLDDEEDNQVLRNQLEVVDRILHDNIDNELLANCLDEMEWVFNSELPLHLHHCVRRLGVRHKNYVQRMVQRGGNAAFATNNRQISPCQLEEVLHHAICKQVLNDPEVRLNDHFSSMSQIN